MLRVESVDEPMLPENHRSDGRIAATIDHQTIGLGGA